MRAMSTPVGPVRYMVIPKRHRRKLILDGRPFVWSLPAHRPSYHWENPAPQNNGTTLTVQADVARPGRVAQVSLSWKEGRSSVTPEVVAIVIRRLLAAGWNPSDRGPAFVMDGIDLAGLATRENVARAVMES